MVRLAMTDSANCLLTDSLLTAGPTVCRTESITYYINFSGASNTRGGSREGLSKFVQTPLFDNLVPDEELQQCYSKAPTTL